MGYLLDATDDQLYLMERINRDAEIKLTDLTIAALNERYGIGVVTGALRYMRGFPPVDGIYSAKAYLKRMCDVMADV